MNQQQHEMYYDYPSGPNRSPGSTRQGYATVGLSSGLGNARSQRQLDALGQHLGSASIYGHDDRMSGGSGYDSMSRFDRLAPSGMQSGYMLENSQTWGYNGGVATMNGPMNGNGRMGSRNVNRRAALPTTWTDQAGIGMPQMPQLFDPNMPMNGNEHDMASMAGQAADSRGMMTTPGSADSDQLIPTAIVIKNIQFQCRKEILQGLMASMNLPQPYAFNYHFDKGVFRGLAFANFSTAEDTAVVIQKMNGLEVMGRKLRVEYKKMLPQDERDRIDREKREKRGQLEEQHRAPLPMHQQSALQALGVSTVNKQPSNSPLRDVDLNDPSTLEFYTQLTLFKNDPSREVHIFPPDVAPEQRRQIHILAHNMGLEHRSVGEQDRRQIQVMKRPQNSPPAHPQAQMPNVSWEDHRRGLSRAATIDFAESRMGSGAYHTLGRQGPTLELPGSPGNGMTNNLRAAKSFADLRAHSPSPAPSGSSYVGLSNGLGRYQDFSQTSLTTPPNLTPTSVQNATSSTDALLAGNMGAMSLGFEANPSQMRARETPGAIGSQRPSANGASGRNAPERQPRGPEWGEAGQGFSGRSRGHMQRSSDSSDTGRNSGAPRFH
ncbi:hypothetical protein F5Y15DRAFT_159979 [Xylariaceae sp. FL0016]|nr:hypothetical protein F5Y15DRAFT_159979 [Xylariaceae sp. FL0016]